MPLLKGLVALALSASLAGCGTAYKEKTAPCKRPAGIAAYEPDPRLECGPMAAVNTNAAAALAAIETMDAN